MKKLLFRKNKLIHFNRYPEVLCPGQDDCLYPGSVKCNTINKGFKDEPEIITMCLCGYMSYCGPYAIALSSMLKADYEKMIRENTFCTHPDLVIPFTQWCCYKCNRKVDSENKKCLICFPQSNLERRKIIYSINSILEEVKDKTCEKDWKKAYSALHNKPWDEVIKHPKTPKWAYMYVKNVLKARWPEAEELIKQSPEWSYYYAHYVLKAPWPEAEDTIKKDPFWAYFYARFVLKARWPEAEDFIKQDPCWAHYYAKYVLKV